MALLWWDPSEALSTTSATAMNLLWDKTGARSAGNILSVTADGGVTPRVGALGTRFFYSSGQTDEFYQTVPDIAVCIVEFWLHLPNVSTDYHVLYLRDGSNNTHFRLSKTHAGTFWNLKLYDAASNLLHTEPVQFGWVHIGIKLTVGNAGVGVLTFKVDDNQKYTDSAADFQNGANQYVSRVTFTGAGGYGYFDDVVIMDGTGGVFDDFQGSGMHCINLTQSGAGDNTDLTPSAGSNYQNVDDLEVDDDATYNSSATAGHRDLYNLAALPAFNGTIAGVVVHGYMRKDNGGVEQAKLAIKTGITVFYGSTETLTNSYAWYLQRYLLNPDTTIAWTQSDINALQDGVEVV